MEAVALIKSISESIDRASERACKGLDVSAAELELLVPLRHHSGELTAARLSDRLNMSRAGVSKHLSRLESRGLIERTASDQDRRTSTVSMTELGRSITDDAFTRDIAVHQQVLGTALDEPEVLDALRTLNRVVTDGLRELN